MEVFSLEIDNLKLELINDFNKLGRKDLVDYVESQIFAPAEALVLMASSDKMVKNAALGEAFLRLVVKWGRKGVEYLGLLQIFAPILVRKAKEIIGKLLDFIEEKFKLKTSSLDRESQIIAKYELKKMKEAMEKEEKVEISKESKKIRISSRSKLASKFIKLANGSMVDPEGNLWKQDGDYIVRYFDADASDPIKEK